MKRRLFWVLGLAGAVGLVVTALAAWQLRPAHLKKEVVNALSERLGLDAALEDMAISFVPRLTAMGMGLTLRIPGHPEWPPYITIDHFTVDVGLFSAMRGHVSNVHLGGLKIVIPPGPNKPDLTPGPGGSPSAPAGRATPPGSPAATAPNAPAAPPEADAAESSGPKASDVVIDHLDAHDSSLTILRSKPGHEPLVFAIHELTIDSLGVDRTMPFKATLTNPIPNGLVESTGTLGPWRKDDPTGFPVSGTYIFSGANLDTISGIGGTLSSRGEYSGKLTRISVTGDSDTPDFNLDLGGKPVPLKATFKANVDATDGTTELEMVDAMLFHTPIKATGAIVNQPGPGRHDITLDVEVRDGRIEDLLKLVIDSPKPLLTGDVNVHAKLALPPGKAKVRERIRLSGQFGLGSAKFTDGDVQAKLVELSRRSQGKDEDEAVGRVMTSLSGHFTLQNAVVSLPDLGFRVPGATVSLGGTYTLADGAIDFKGTLRMQATVSKAVGGFKSIFLKPFDFIFRKNGAGAVLPIKIGGTRDHPTFGLQVGKALRGGG